MFGHETVGQIKEDILKCAVGNCGGHFSVFVFDILMKKIIERVIIM